MGEVTGGGGPGTSVRVVVVEPALQGLKVATLVPLGQFGVFTVRLIQRQIPQLYSATGN